MKPERIWSVKRPILSFSLAFGVLFITLNCTTKDCKDLKVKNHELSLELDLLKSRYQWIVENSNTYERPGRKFFIEKLNEKYNDTREEIYVEKTEKRTNALR